MSWIMPPDPKGGAKIAPRTAAEGANLTTIGMILTRATHATAGIHRPSRPY